MNERNYKRIRDRIVALEREHGGGRAAARTLGIDHVYLWRIKHGYRIPGDETMEKLGLRWIVEEV